MPGFFVGRYGGGTFSFLSHIQTHLQSIQSINKIAPGAVSNLAPRPTGKNERPDPRLRKRWNTKIL